MILQFENNTKHPSELLQTLVLFAQPNEWKQIPESSHPLYHIIFQEDPLIGSFSVNQAEFDGSAIRIHVPDLLELPLYGNRVIIEARGPAIIGGGYSPEKYQLPEDEQLPIENFTEWLLVHVAHEIHHAYLHWVNPANYTNAKHSSDVEAAQEKDCERYSIEVVRSWREQRGGGDLPFPELQNIRDRVRQENARIDEARF